MASEKDSLSIFKLLSGLYQTFVSLLTDFADLAALELRLAGKSFLAILCLGIIAILLIISAWFCFLAFMVALLATFLKLPWAFFVIFMVNLLCIIPIGLIISRLASNLTFPATRRQFKAFKNQAAKVEDEQIT